ncbi:hypothetical protein ASE93_11575 [Serratia sp. Leaf50]|nr:hypothetical protein ASE93_11575 [Serratia sp. Leaf50]
MANSFIISIILIIYDFLARITDERAAVRDSGSYILSQKFCVGFISQAVLRVAFSGTALLLFGELMKPNLIT